MSEENTPNEMLIAEPTETGQETDSPADENTVKEGAPENYEFEFPEGFEKDDTLIEQITPIFKEANLSQAQAQKLVNWYAEHSQAQRENEIGAWDNMQKEWVNTTKADKEVGGADFMEKLAVAKKAVDQYGSPELKALFNFTGVGNHVEMVKFLYKVGKAISEDKIISGRGQDQPRDLAKLLYPTMAN